MQGCYSNKTLLERYFGFQMPCHFLTIPILKSMIREPSSGTYLSYRYSNALPSILLYHLPSPSSRRISNRTLRQTGCLKGANLGVELTFNIGYRKMHMMSYLLDLMRGYTTSYPHCASLTLLQYRASSS